MFAKVLRAAVAVIAALGAVIVVAPGAAATAPSSLIGSNLCFGRLAPDLVVSGMHVPANGSAVTLTITNVGSGCASPFHVYIGQPSFRREFDCTVYWGAAEHR